VKVYRVHLLGKDLKSRGFKFTTNLFSANAIARDIPKGHSAQVESADISLTREGLLAALNRFASHPNNG